MKPEGSLPHLKTPATCPYPESDQSTQCHLSHSFKIPFSINLPSTPRSSKWSLSLRFPYQNLYAQLFSITRATWPAHFILLDLITRKPIFRGLSFRGGGRWGLNFHCKNCFVRSTVFSSYSDWLAAYCSVTVRLRHGLDSRDIAFRSPASTSGPSVRPSVRLTPGVTRAARGIAWLLVPYLPGLNRP